MIMNIEIDRLRENPINPRKKLRDVTELADSIRAQGVLQNLTVVLDDADMEEFHTLGRRVQEEYVKAYKGDITVVIGHHRLAAAKIAGLRELPCSIADLDEISQLAVIMVENKQRNDLTLAEEVHGFQMMMDMGETVPGIAHKTGIGETTVRRRLKLAELDDELLDQAEERGARLEDYEALNKINDIGLKNKVLENIGTNDFRWSFTKAVEREKKDRILEGLLPQFDKFAERLNEVDRSTYKYISSWSILGNEDTVIEPPEDADSREYFYSVTSFEVGLWVLREEEAEQEEDAEKRKTFEDHTRRREGLVEATARAYKLRKDFFLNYPATRVKRNQPKIISYIGLTLALGGWFCLPKDIISEFLGVEYEKDQENSKAAEEVYEAALETVINGSPERVLIMMACHFAEDCDRNGYFKYSYLLPDENESLDRLYSFLESLGYGMSEEERALQDGTHELFTRSEEATDEE